MREASSTRDPQDDSLRDLLERARGGSEHARAELVGKLYPEIHARAGWMMQRQPPGHTLQATDLANEVCIKVLASSRQVSWLDHAHALAVACTAMRHVLLDYARNRSRQKRSHGKRLSIDSLLLAYEDRGIDIVELDDALQRFAEVDPEIVRAFEMRVFGGMALEDIAKVLNMPYRQFQSRWNAAKRMVDAELTEGAP